jgi:hypothetical protein
LRRLDEIERKLDRMLAVSLIVAVCAAATGSLASSVVEFVYWVLN